MNAQLQTPEEVNLWWQSPIAFVISTLFPLGVKDGTDTPTTLPPAFLVLYRWHIIFLLIAK